MLAVAELSYGTFSSGVELEVRFTLLIQYPLADSLFIGIASYTNAAIKFLQSKVSIAFRTRLTRYIHDLYLNDNLAYYKLGNLDGGIGQADQFITQDLTLFCASAASLYSSIGKPLVDLCVFNYQLFQSLGPLALTGLIGNYIITAVLLRRLSPPFGKLKAVEARREGDFRSLHSRLITNAEEIALYGGADMEKVFLDKCFSDLRHWMEGIYSLKIRYNMLEVRIPALESKGILSSTKIRQGFRSQIFMVRFWLPHHLSACVSPYLGRFRYCS